MAPRALAARLLPPASLGASRAPSLATRLRRTAGLLALVLAACCVGLGEAEAAAPDPAVASGLSAASTLVPLAGSAGVLFTGRGKDEKVRYDFGIGFLALGSIFGPSVGQVYAGAGSDAAVTFVLRLITGTLMTVGAGIALRSTENDDAGRALFVVAAVPTGLLALWDIIGAASSAREARTQERMAVGGGEGERLVSLALCGPIPCAL